MIIRELHGPSIYSLNNSGYHMNHGVTISHHRINGIHMGVSNPWGPNFLYIIFGFPMKTIQHLHDYGTPEKTGPAPPGRSQALMAAFNEMVSICSDASPISWRKASAICRFLHDRGGLKPMTIGKDYHPSFRLC